GVLAELAANHPWCVNATLALYDLVCPGALKSAALPGPAAVLLYTFNKAAELEVTLASLERSLQDAPGVSRIVVLDNGSTDDTPLVLSAAAGRLGADALRVVRLPVNVGAPAARNWLRREPEAASAEFIVYMDDDVDLPAHWLTRLAAAHAAYPGAGVYACKVVDQARPLLIQSADLHLEALPPAPDGQDDSRTAPAARRFEMSTLHHQVLDFGQFDYLRPCASVTGCLHMFAAAELEACGDFDLRFSPSQFDDLDHDLRLLAGGKVPVFQGCLSLPHLKRTGTVSGVGGAGYGTGFANQYKLHGKYSREEIRRMAELADRAVWDDYLAKWTALHDQPIRP
ncbi:MAG: glycosyltransferase family 2 protein, partial [Desulfovibrionaceae bacterium]|nr:glycosyltransferase family 2 protein [Desulfovibrionaceae bacterium]